MAMAMAVSRPDFVWTAESQWVHRTALHGWRSEKNDERHGTPDLYYVEQVFKPVCAGVVCVVCGVPSARQRLLGASPDISSTKSNMISCILCVRLEPYVCCLNHVSVS